MSSGWLSFLKSLFTCKLLGLLHFAYGGILLLELNMPSNNLSFHLIMERFHIKCAQKDKIWEAERVCVCVCVPTCVSIHVWWWWWWWGWHWWEAGDVGKTDSVELKVVELIPSLSSIPLEASWVSNGKWKRWRDWTTLWHPYSKYCPHSSNNGVVWVLMRNAASQFPPQTCWIRVCV